MPKVRNRLINVRYFSDGLFVLRKSPVALSVARELVVRLRPGGDNENSVDPLQFECGPMDRLADLPAWIGSHLSDNLSVEVLANRVCLCPRHFGRLFKHFFQLHQRPLSNG